MLRDQIITDLKTAMLAKDELATSTLRMLKAEIMKYEVSGKNMEATDEVVTDLLKKGIKQRNEAAEGFKKGGNQAAADKEMAEAEILKKYLPEQMSEEQVKAVVQETIDQLKPAGPPEPSAPLGPSFGQVMGAVMGKVKGKADGNIVSKVVKELLV